VKLGVLGLGSMGSRRVRDLLALGHDVRGHDVREDRNQRAETRFGIRTEKSLAALLRGKLDALVICTPPDQHVECYQVAFESKLPFFSEASILTPQAEWFSANELRYGVSGYPSATWRFYAPLMTLARLIHRINAPAIAAVHHEYADFLPRWHPWEPYSEFYAGARKQTSAAREMVPFEFEWLCWLFGPVESISAVMARLGTWSTDIDDTYHLHVLFVSGLHATVRIELHREAAARTAMICGEAETYQLDFNSPALRRYEPQTAGWSEVSVPEEESGSSDLEKTYAAEIGAFVAALRGDHPYPKTWVEDRHLSDVLFAAELSARERRTVVLAEVASAYDGLSVE
jgi:predicted dehydrogenase